MNQQGRAPAGPLVVRAEGKRPRRRLLLLRHVLKTDLGDDERCSKATPTVDSDPRSPVPTIVAHGGRERQATSYLLCIQPQTYTVSCATG